MRAYLDNNSTTACAPEVVAEMLPFFAEEYGNPSSPHGAGRAASQALAEARDRVAHVIGTQPDNIVFTACATEANNMALLGVVQGFHKRRKIIVCATEH